MKQIIQSFKTGETILEEVPTPQVGRGQVLIKTTRSLVSLGTERMLVEFGKASLIQKARQQPDKVKMVLDKIKSDGLMPTLEAVFNKLGQPLPLGYCNVGKVIAVGSDVHEFQLGDRVASNGTHAEFVCVPKNLVAKIPDEVSDEEATFTIIGSIGLQGIRLLKPSMGETVVVTGLGLIGLITAQLLKANGCQVIGLDVDESKLKVAANLGITTFNPNAGDPVQFVMQQTEKIGADGVIITASSKSNDIIAQAANMSRKRGRIILVGVIGLQLNRADFYEKELTFQVSCSYGPGRYDDEYEQKGHDYPLPYVRWTEKRNFETILHAIRNKQIDVSSLISEQVKLEDFIHIYGQIGSSNAIASIIQYDEKTQPSHVVATTDNKVQLKKGKMAIIGAGNFTKMTMLPNLNAKDVRYIVSKGGLSAKTLADKHHIPYSASSFDEVLKDDQVSLIAITTRHDLHAEMTLKALNHEKDVFVEKPLALNLDDVLEIEEAAQKSGRSVYIGFNRRFSPHIQKMKQLVPVTSAKNMVAIMNAGAIPPDVWVHDMEVGGGRIIGEACHHIDLLSYISGSPITTVCMNALGNSPKVNTDNASILLRFANGDQGVVHYFANGNKACSKERIEVYFDEQVITMDNFRVTKGYGTKGFSKLKTRLDKGHKAQFHKLSVLLNEGGEPLMKLDEIINVSKASLAAIESLSRKSWIKLYE